MHKLFYNNAWWQPTDMKIVEILAEYKIFEKAGSTTFDRAFFEAVKCGRIVPALPPKNGELISEFV
jgi:hypothetical protein